MKITKKRGVDYILYTAIILGGILIDQITKLLASTYLKVIDTFPIIEGVIHLTYAENTGAAFGILKNHRWVFLLISTVTIIGMAAYLYLFKTDGRLYDVSMAMIISGGLGNMLDRVGLGYVVDFIDFRLINFAVFNGADSFVCVGAGLLMLALIRDLIKESKAERQA
jgi:signal peptidase II